MSFIMLKNYNVKYVIVIESWLFEGIMEKSMHAFDEIINFFYIKYTKCFTNTQKLRCEIFYVVKCKTFYNAC